jgi:hypothetical protein
MRLGADRLQRVDATQSACAKACCTLENGTPRHWAVERHLAMGHVILLTTVKLSSGGFCSSLLRPALILVIARN